MKIYVGHSTEYDFMNELYKPIMDSELNNKVEFIFPHLTDETFNSIQVIEQVDLFIAEVSRPSLGLGIEIGMAEMKNKRILCIYKENSNISSSLKYINADILSYVDKEDMIQEIEHYIENLD